MDISAARKLADRSSLTLGMRCMLYVAPATPSHHSPPPSPSPRPLPSTPSHPPQGGGEDDEEDEEKDVEEEEVEEE